jgi:endo-1,4-beta-xylanase
LIAGCFIIVIVAIIWNKSDKSVAENIEVPMPPAPFTVSRRTALVMLSAGLGTGLSPLLNAKTLHGPSLGDLAAAKGIRFGSVVSAIAGGYTHPEVAALLAGECRIIVPENELKMYIIEKDEGVVNFEPADGIFNFCKQHHLAMRGHTLWWARDKYSPYWLLKHDFGKNPKLEAERMLRDYTAMIIDHYGDSIVSWDVVNEILDPKTGEIRDSVFQRILGMDALRITYEVAREKLPKTQLVYNDYMCWETGKENHRAGALKLLHWFREEKLPVDALGIQSHLGFDYALESGQHAEWKRFLDEVTSMGYDLLITELDVNDQYTNGDIKQRDAVVARVARDYLDLTLSYKQVTDVLLWGISDSYSWLQTVKPRLDGEKQRCTPYDEKFQPKPLRDAIATAFKTAPQR